MMGEERLPLVQGLLKYQAEGVHRFHMPGHMGKSAAPYFDLLKEHLFHFDVTEVPGTDNLHYPQDALRSSQRLLSQAMEAAESFYSVGGTTASNYAALFGLLKRGDTLLVERGCHQSIHNAVALLELNPIFMEGRTHPTLQLPAPLTLPEVEAAYAAAAPAKPKALVLTTPSYYGAMADIAAMAAFAEEKGLRLLVDAAHGAHLPFSPLLPDSAMAAGAHVSTVSFHKTLPALTQGGVLNLSPRLTEEERSRIREWHRVFQSSSPSYLLLASMELARHHLEEEGHALYAALLPRIRMLKDRLAATPGLRVLEAGDLSPLQDPTRLVVETPLPGALSEERLRTDFAVQAEMHTGRCLVFILTPAHEEADLLALEAGLRSLAAEAGPGTGMPGTVNAAPPPPLPKRFLLEQEAREAPYEFLPVTMAVGRIAAERITPYPPGVPLILPGEGIDRAFVAHLLRIQEAGTEIQRTRSSNPQEIAVLREGAEEKPS